MVSESVLTKLIAKGFVMAGLTPTLDELHDALLPYEHSLYCQPGTPPMFRGTIKKVNPNKDIQFTRSDTNEYDLHANLWLDVI